MKEQKNITEEIYFLLVAILKRGVMKLIFITYRHPLDVQKSVLIIRRPTIIAKNSFQSLNNDDFDNEYNFQLQQSGMREVVEQNTFHIGYL